MLEKPPTPDDDDDGPLSSKARNPTSTLYVNNLKPEPSKNEESNENEDGEEDDFLDESNEMPMNMGNGGLLDLSRMLDMKK